MPMPASGAPPVPLRESSPVMLQVSRLVSPPVSLSVLKKNAIFANKIVAIVAARDTSKGFCQ